MLTSTSRASRTTRSSLTGTKPREKTFLAPVKKHSRVISPSGDSVWSITSLLRDLIWEGAGGRKGGGEWGVCRVGGVVWACARAVSQGVFHACAAMRVQWGCSVSAVPSALFGARRLSRNGVISEVKPSPS